MAKPSNISHSERQTKALGTSVAKSLRGGEVLLLTGNLGAGKTTFVKGLAKGLGVKHNITSPTFVLMKVYPVHYKKIKQLVHVDCYRLPGVEFSAIGLGDYLGQPDTVVAIEWAGKLRLRMHKLVRIKFKNARGLNERIITVQKAAP